MSEDDWTRGTARILRRPSKPEFEGSNPSESAMTTKCGYQEERSDRDYVWDCANDGATLYFRGLKIDWQVCPSCRAKPTAPAAINTYSPAKDGRVATNSTYRRVMRAIESNGGALPVDELASAIKMRPDRCEKVLDLMLAEGYIYQGVGGVLFVAGADK